MKKLSLYFRKKETPEIIYVGDLHATIIRTKRKKTASIKIKNGITLVSVPKLTPESEIKSLLINKRNWIEKQHSIHKQAAVLTFRNYVEGEFFNFRGKPRCLSFQTTQYTGSKIFNDQLLISPIANNFSSEHIKKLISKLFKESAEQYLKERTEYYAKKMALYPSNIQVKRYKSRWGSCSINGQVSYNWLIIIAPDPIIDYIVIHELCHLIEYNHSPSFWKLVEQFSPCYKKHRNWLQENRLLLVI